MTEPGERLWSLWERGQRPDLASFLREVGPLSLPQLLAVLRVDQCCRWRAGSSSSWPSTTPWALEVRGRGRVLTFTLPPGSLGVNRTNRAAKR